MAPNAVSHHGRRRLIWRLCVNKGVPRRSFLAAVVVGSILSLINQYEALFGPAAINWYKIALTYCVPYVVATYGAVSAQLRGPAEGSRLLNSR